ncbi:hypothetical protein J5N97_002666 [Dioscorea zingiberensis]|uniref:Uncharacterized protein n=1 Tax=Dioscorea zingiberensis TaxID=325984 RepID=A0A9D5D578_9LILI|nr:hypothetical protein J5N97_002666 [Dioscorea zingiberensis]
MDDDEWTSYARKYIVLAANELISFRDPSKRVPWRKLIPPRLHPPLRWGKRKRRSGRGRVASPQTPLEFPYSVSRSVACVGGKRSDADPSKPDAVPFAGVETKVEQTPSRLHPRLTKPIRARKKTIPELQEEERSLLADRQGFRKLLEETRNTLQVLLEANEGLRRKKLTLDSERAAMLAASTTSEQLQSHKNPIQIPDLNEPPDLNDQEMEEFVE